MKTPEELRADKEAFEANLSRLAKAAHSEPLDAAVQEAIAEADAPKAPSAKKLAKDAKKAAAKVKQEQKAADSVAKKVAKRVAADKKPVKTKAPKKDPGAPSNTIKALETAKARYKAKGDVSNCGDWLAKTLKEAFLHPKEGFDFDAFVACCTANGLDTSEKWAINRAPGWQGRFRMNGRQKLEIVVAKQGYLKINGKKVEPTGVFLKAMRDRHEFDEDEDDSE